MKEVLKIEIFKTIRTIIICCTILQGIIFVLEETQTEKQVETVVCHDVLSIDPIMMEAIEIHIPKPKPKEITK